MFSLAPSALRSVDIDHWEVTSFGGRNSSHFYSRLRRNTRLGCHFFIQFIIHPTACSDESFILTCLDRTGQIIYLNHSSIHLVMSLMDSSDASVESLALDLVLLPWSFVWDLVLELLVDVVIGDLQEGEEVLVDPSIICSLVGTLQGLRDSQ